MHSCVVIMCFASFALTPIVRSCTQNMRNTVETCPEQVLVSDWPLKRLIKQRFVGKMWDPLVCSERHNFPPDFMVVMGWSLCALSSLLESLSVLCSFGCGIKRIVSVIRPFLEEFLTRQHGLLFFGSLTGVSQNFLKILLQQVSLCFWNPGTDLWVHMGRRHVYFIIFFFFSFFFFLCSSGELSSERIELKFSL